VADGRPGSLYEAKVGAGVQGEESLNRNENRVESEVIVGCRAYPGLPSQPLLLGLLGSYRNR
jgi:hypothetical protein